MSLTFSASACRLRQNAAPLSWRKSHAARIYVAKVRASTGRMRPCLCPAAQTGQSASHFSSKRMTCGFGYQVAYSHPEQESIAPSPTSMRHFGMQILLVQA